MKPSLLCVWPIVRTFWINIYSNMKIVPKRWAVYSDFLVCENTSRYKKIMDENNFTKK